MAIVWSRRLSGVQYEVRSAGNSLRLYTDGVFHSQYNPHRLITGHVWDLLMLPAFFYPSNKIKRVLVMGVAGGAVLHQLRHFVGPDEIIGVELNKQHVSIGRRFFDLKKPPIKLIEADAVSWLEAYQGEAFDMIIDDMFAEKNGEPVPVKDASADWFACMHRHLTAEGLIVRNFINRKALLRSAPIANAQTRANFKSIFQFTSQYNENFVAAYLKTSVSARQLRHRLCETPGLNPRLKTTRLRYSLRQLL
jgi:spermidine synthase